MTLTTTDAALAVTVAAALAAACGSSDAPVLTEVPAASNWTAPARIHPDSHDDLWPVIAVSRRGEVLALWEHWEDGAIRYSRIAVQSSRFSPGSGWDRVSAIPLRDDQEYVSGIGLDDDGMAIVVGSSYDRARPRGSWAHRSTPGSSWSAREELPSGGGDGSGPAVVLLQPGVALIAWLERGADGVRGNAWASVYDGNWKPAEPIAAVGSRIQQLRVITDGRGRVLGTWSHEDSGPMGATLFDLGLGWTDPHVFGTAIDAASAAFDGAGGAIAVWAAQDAVMLSRMIPGAGWTAPTRGPGKEPIGASVAVSARGDALVAWTQSPPPGSGYYEVRAATWSPSSGWGAEELLGVGFLSQVVIDDAGRGVVLWEGEGSPVSARSHSPRTGWGPVVTMGRGGSIAAGIDASGVVTAVWQAFEDDSILYARLDLAAP
jgi:hypothetical protein